MADTTQNAATATTASASTPANASQGTATGANASTQSEGSSSANGTASDTSKAAETTEITVKPSVVEAVAASNEQQALALKSKAKIGDEPDNTEVRITNEEHVQKWKTPYQFCFMLPRAKLHGPYTVPAGEVTLYDQGFGIPAHVADAIGLTVDGKRTEYTESAPEEVDTEASAKA